MEIVALLLTGAFALTFVAFTNQPRKNTEKPAPVRVPANNGRNGRRVNRSR